MLGVGFAALGVAALSRPTANERPEAATSAWAILSRTAEAFRATGREPRVPQNLTFMLPVPQAVDTGL